jgi:hypothetical protein
MAEPMTLGRAEPVGGGAVHVRAYTRTVNGRPVAVGEHQRADPPGGDADTTRIPKDDRRAAPGEADPAVVMAARRDRCEAQRIRDEAICRILASRSCWASASERYAQCLRGGYIPRLVTE